MQIITNKKLYDACKYVALVVLPAIGALYFALAQIWGLPSGEEVVGSIVAVDAFLGVVLHFSKDGQYDGVLTVIESDEKKLFDFNVHGDPNDLDQKDEIKLKVNKAS